MNSVTSLAICLPQQSTGHSGMRVHGKEILVMDLGKEDLGKECPVGQSLRHARPFTSRHLVWSRARHALLLHKGRDPQEHNVGNGKEANGAP